MNLGFDTVYLPVPPPPPPWLYWLFFRWILVSYSSSVYSGKPLEEDVDHSDVDYRSRI